MNALLQMKPARMGWGSAAGWIAALLSFPAGGLAAQALVGAVDHPADGLIGGAAAGLVIGLGQWLVLRRTHHIKALWIAATALGMAGGLGLGGALFGNGTGLTQIVERGVVTGGLLGLVQSAILTKKLSLAAMWTLVVTGTFTLSWVISSRVIVNALDNGYAIFGSSGALIFQIVTGLALLLVAEDPAEISEK